MFSGMELYFLTCCQIFYLEILKYEIKVTDLVEDIWDN